jgi:uncharacterized membrane protein YeaQ/YmgE (transglycosylase-associated protein family)
MWEIAGVLACIGLAGSKRVFQIVTGVIAAFIASLLFSEFALTLDASSLFSLTVVVAAAGTIILATVWLFAVARRRALLQAPTVWTAAGLWAAATVIVAFQRPLDAETRWLFYLFIACIFALAVAPLAAAPLALAANRHR